MTQTFAIDVIQTLHSDEANEFRLFLESPYFMQGFKQEGVRPLFEALYLAVQNGTIETLEKEDLHEQLFPGREYVESKLDKLMSELKRLLERFVLVQRYLSDDNEAQQLLDISVDMRLRGLETRYQQALEKTKKKADHAGGESLKSLFFRYRLAMEEQEWHSTFNKGKGDLNIPETINHLDVYYFAHRLWMQNHLLFMQRAASIPITLEQIVDIPQKALQSSHFLDISRDVHVLLNKDALHENDFNQILHKIQSHEQSLSPESLAEFYAYLRNLCVILIDAGHTHIHAVLHEINKDNLRRGYFYLHGKISPNACLSMMQTALSVNDIPWASEFIEVHKDNILGENETQDFYRMNKALCLFGEKKYEEALEMIPFGSTYSFYHLMARRLELKIHYELRSELLDHKIDAFKMFISRAGRKVFSANLHELFTNFVNFVRQLSQSDGPQARQRSQTLLKRISEKERVAERLWLLEKARELGGKR
ncbi:MAG: hypothetical protein SFV22_12525 [Saprospiraceae bacterium]|nr:hypothetical protein [Saprospiraceae bacterium]